MTGVIRPSRRLVYRDKRGESSVPVLELHVLDQDGMSLAEHLYLVGESGTPPMDFSLNTWFFGKMNSSPLRSALY